MQPDSAFHKTRECVDYLLAPWRLSGGIGLHVYLRRYGPAIAALTQDQPC